MSLIISIDGNIGSGKSTIINNLKNQFVNENYIIFIEEPVDEWIKIKDSGKNILEKFYEDPIKYAFPFQMMALITRFHTINEIIKKNPKALIITERSLYTDKYIFAKMLFESNKMNTIEYQIYNKWFSKFMQKLPEHKYIYISSDPNICFERIQERNRVGEDKIDIDYLTSCNQYHNDMFNKINPNLNINIDDKDLKSNEYNKILNKIRTFILDQHIKQDNKNFYLVFLNFIIFYWIIKFLF
jgi:deoxyadenosine/deoxycytidine kinase